MRVIVEAPPTAPLFLHGPEVLEETTMAFWALFGGLGPGLTYFRGPGMG